MPSRRINGVGAVAAIVFLAGSPAIAQGAEIVSEVKAGVLAHDIGILGASEEDGADGNFEVLFQTPDVLEPLWSPRPHVGVAVSTAGQTSQLYAGLTWTWHPLGGSLWGAFSFGGAVHNGETGASLTQKELGSRVLFRESLEVGFDITEAWNVSLYLSHISNANLAEQNEGLDNAGLRIGWHF